MYISYTCTYAHTRKRSKHGIMLKTGRSEKDFFTMLSVNFKLFQSKRLNRFKNKYSANKSQIKILYKG